MNRFLRLYALSIAWLMIVPVFATAQRTLPNAEPTTQESPEAKLREAAGHYAVIEIMLDQGRSEAIAEEFQKILDLNLTGPQERQLGQAAWKIVHRLAEQRQFGLAHDLIEMTLERVEQPETRFSLLMLQAKVFQAQRLLPQALESVRRAQQELDQTGSGRSPQR